MAGFLLPPNGTEAREAMGDVAYVAEVLCPKNKPKLKGAWEAIQDAKELFAVTDVVAVTTIVLLMNGDRVLARVARDDEPFKVLWNFGKGYDV